MLDPGDINARLYRQIGVLLDQLEAVPEEGAPKITLRERIQALIAIGRLQTIFMGLRKEKSNEPEAGSTVRKYAAAFANDPRGGAARAGAGGSADEPDEPAGADGEWWDADDGDDPEAAPLEL